MSATTNGAEWEENLPSLRKNAKKYPNKEIIATANEKKLKTKHFYTNNLTLTDKDNGQTIDLLLN